MAMPNSGPCPFRSLARSGRRTVERRTLSWTHHHVVHLSMGWSRSVAAQRMVTTVGPIVALSSRGDDPKDYPDRYAQSRSSARARQSATTHPRER